jgi:hypothetical protein
MWRNRVRERKWNSMSKEEREAYLASFSNGRGGNKRLDFRFVH